VVVEKWVVHLDACLRDSCLRDGFVMVVGLSWQYKLKLIALFCILNEANGFNVP
jgi:hypothetical protein